MDPMRIAYVALGLEPRNMAGGVGRKVNTQTRLWGESGHAARVFAILPGTPDPDFYGYQARSTVPGMLQITRAISRSGALQRLLDDVRLFHPDIIYLRAGAYVYPLHRLFPVAPVVVELNSNDIAQKALQGRSAFWFNLLTRPLILGRSAGLVAVTREIADLPANRRYRKPSCVIGNGIDLQQYDPLPAPRHSTPVLTMVGSPGMRWHGVDKLMRLAEICVDLKINIVGYGPADLGYEPPANVQLHGFLDAAGVREVLKESDVACGSLALHRNKMQEGSTLKVPEAMAYGIPILLAYRDTDLAALQDECILQLPNTEDNVVAHATLIRSFAYRMMGRRLSRGDIAHCIDQRAKEEARLAFFAEVLGRSRHNAV